MAVTSTVLDGNNVALAFAGSVSADAFTLNTSTGAVTSSYLPASWCSILRQNALKLFAVTTLAQRATAGFLDRLVAIGSVDGTTITTASAVGAGTATLRVTVSANTTVLVQLPHSIFGAASLGQSVPATGGGGGGSVVASDLGLVLWTNTIDGAVIAGDLVGVSPFGGTLVRATANPSAPVQCIGVYTLDSASNACIRVAGEIAVTGGPFSGGETIYLGLAGAATSIPPSASGSYRQVVGFAAAVGDLFVQPGFVEVV